MKQGRFEVDHGTEQKQDRAGIDNNLHTLVLDDFVQRFGRFDIVHDIFHARTATIGDADAQIACALLIHDGAHTLGGHVGEAHDFRSWSSGHVDEMGPFAQLINPPRPQRL